MLSGYRKLNKEQTETVNNLLNCLAHARGDVQRKLLFKQISELIGVEDPLKFMPDGKRGRNGWRWTLNRTYLTLYKRLSR